MVQQSFEHLFNEQAFQSIFVVPLEVQIEQNQQPKGNALSKAAINTPFKLEFEEGYYVVSPLYYAIKLAHGDWVKYLLQQGAYSNWQAEQIHWSGIIFEPRYNALHHLLNSSFTYDTQIDLIKLLLAKGANPDGQDSLGYTPLHLLMHHPLTQPTRLLADSLIQSGANLSIRNHSGLTVIEMAQQNGYFDWALWLESTQS